MIGSYRELLTRSCMSANGRKTEASAITGLIGFFCHAAINSPICVHAIDA